MADPIDRQELRKAMYHEAFETDSDEQRWDSGCWIRYKMFERILGSMPPAQPERKTEEWTPCSERLPEDGRYLCDYGDCIDFGRVTHGKWYVYGAIAWMPLPKPYKEDSDG